MQLSSVRRASTTDLQRIIAFSYMFLCCLNQYIKIGGIPVFIFLILIYSLLKLFKNDFVIRNSYSQIMNSKRWVFNFFSIWIIYGIVFSAIISNEASWRNILYITINIIGFYNVFVDSYYHEKLRVCFVRGIICGLFANVLVAVWEIQTKNHIMPLSADYIRRFANVPLGFYVNTNDLAIVLIFFLVTVSVSFIYNNNRTGVHLKSLLIGLIIIGCGVVFKTGSLISTATIVSLIAVSYLFYQFKKNGNNAFLILIVLLFCVLVFLIVDNGNIFKKFSIDIDDPAFTSRGDLWKVTLEKFKSTSYIGIGPGQNSVIGVGSVHNLVLEILTEYGPVIGLFFCVLYISLFKQIVSLKSTLITNVGFSFFLLMIPMSICSSSMTKLFPIWPCIGMILCYVFLDSERRKI